LEFKQEAVRQLSPGRRVTEVARDLGISEQTLSNWVKAEASGKLNGSGKSSTLTADQVEIRRLRAKLAQAEMERDILGKATAFFAKSQK
jgi:transposase